MPEQKKNVNIFDPEWGFDHGSIRLLYRVPSPNQPLFSTLRVRINVSLF